MTKTFLSVDGRQPVGQMPIMLATYSTSKIIMTKMML